MIMQPSGGIDFCAVSLSPFSQVSVNTHRSESLDTIYSWKDGILGITDLALMCDIAILVE